MIFRHCLQRFVILYFKSRNKKGKNIIRKIIGLFLFNIKFSIVYYNCSLAILYILLTKAFQYCMVNFIFTKKKKKRSVFRKALIDIAL